VWHDTGGEAPHSKDSLFDDLLLSSAPEQFCYNVLLQVFSALELFENGTKG
jgi:hypothetical protein